MRQKTAGHSSLVCYRDGVRLVRSERHARGGSLGGCELGLLALITLAPIGCGADDARIIGADSQGSESPPDLVPPPRSSPPSAGASAATVGDGPATSGDEVASASPPNRADAPTAAPGATTPITPEAPGSAAGDFVWGLPLGFPLPIVPADNPMTLAKVALGRHLFHDPRLSQNGTASCATCHRQELAFTDGRAAAVGSTGQTHARGSMSLANVAYATTLTWSHPYLTELERQAAVPIFGESPVELGWTSELDLEERLASIPEYTALFGAAFPDDAEPLSAQNAMRGLAAFERTLISGRSPYDRWAYDADESALSDSARRGLELFYSERLECFHCHVGFNLSDQVSYSGRAFPEAPFHNTGLYNVDGEGGFPPPSTGVHELTRQAADMGKFKAPTLRNIAVTAPYMHDGSIISLAEVLDHYAAGGRTITEGPSAGVGSESPLRSDLIRGFSLSEAERADVIAFLEALTDEGFLTNPAFSNPWP